MSAEAPSPDTQAPTALVLGASGALGGAIARKLFEKGYRLGLHAFQHPERIPAFHPAPARPAPRSYRADFRDGEQVRKLAKQFLADLGRLDALVWAAGITRDAPAARQPERELREILAVDLSAPFLLGKAFTRAFLKQKSGRVILIASHAGLSGRAGGAAYAMAQSGLLALAKSLAREWGAAGIQVNAIIPPFVPDSAMGRAASPLFAEAVKKKNVLKSGPGPAAAVAAFTADLLSNESASGQVFTLDARL